mmetsp:Transcript_46903/g.134094  ORF Transcript_46903/g.134094 Transcript_46903/m.134094 type:complete len:218 (+) Transcript_46903:57-710(+)
MLAYAPQVTLLVRVHRVIASAHGREPLVDGVPARVHIRAVGLHPEGTLLMGMNLHTVLHTNPLFFLRPLDGVLDVLLADGALLLLRASRLGHLMSREVDVSLIELLDGMLPTGDDAIGRILARREMGPDLFFCNCIVLTFKEVEPHALGPEVDVGFVHVAHLPERDRVDVEHPLHAHLDEAGMEFLDLTPPGAVQIPPAHSHVHLASVLETHIALAF